MLYRENMCVDCETCVKCGQDNVLVKECDGCESSVDELWEYNGLQYCENCIAGVIMQDVMLDTNTKEDGVCSECGCTGEVMYFNEDYETFMCLNCFMEKKSITIMDNLEDYAERVTDDE